jgi:hypothetical protein
MGKTKYFCTTCGKGFTTGNAARRHVRTVEKGVGMAVTEASYTVGLATGVFSPSLPGKPPKFEISRKSRDKPPVVIEYDEFLKGFWRRAGELWCEKMYNDPEEKAKLDVLFQGTMIQHLSEMMRNNIAESAREDAIRSTAETANIFSNIFGSWYKQQGQKGI